MLARPDRHQSQLPQGRTEGTSTRSPTARGVAPLPSSSIVPEISWPRMSGGGLAVGTPWSR